MKQAGVRGHTGLCQLCPGRVLGPFGQRHCHLRFLTVWKLGWASLLFPCCSPLNLKGWGWASKVRKKDVALEKGVWAKTQKTAPVYACVATGVHTGLTSPWPPLPGSHPCFSLISHGRGGNRVTVDRWGAESSSLEALSKANNLYTTESPECTAA